MPPTHPHPRPVAVSTEPPAAPAPAASPAAPNSAGKSSPGGLRALTEWLVLLALAVTLFRGFAVEGYMISTGSMAPSLWGYHARITCPSCGMVFAHGVAPPESVAGRSDTAQAASVAMAEGGTDVIPCPNCSRLCTTGQGATPTEGDQLLVHKDAFAWRRIVHRGGPRRWEIAVFHTPDDAQMAYVKRIVGLPGEGIDILDGDVLANGQLLRKPLDAQLNMRIPVSLHDRQVADVDPNWDTRWLSETPGSAWTSEGPRFEHRPHSARNAPRTARTTQPDWDWITYRHWIRSGGATTTSVPLPRWPDGLTFPDPFLSSLEYLPAEGRLTCLGALSHAQWEHWDAATDDAGFQRALWELFRESHVVPLTDATSYNSQSAGHHQIRDLMLELTLVWRGGSGEFAIEMTDGAREFRAEIDCGQGEVRLIADDSRTLQTGTFTVSRDTPTVLLMSTFDQQVLLAQDGRLIGDPIPYDRGDEPPAPLRRPVRFGARDADVMVEHIGLYRDIYYTPPPVDTPQPMQLHEDEYFVLGDNSGVSIDSRHWDHPGVPDAALIGKPVLVHLPSRPLRVEWGGKVRRFRVPDFGRMRYIR